MALLVAHTTLLDISCTGSFGKAFNQDGYLKQHLRKHNESPYKCGYGIIESKSLKQQLSVCAG